MSVSFYKSLSKFGVNESKIIQGRLVLNEQNSMSGYSVAYVCCSSHLLLFRTFNPLIRVVRASLYNPNTVPPVFRGKPLHTIVGVLR